MAEADQVIDCCHYKINGCKLCLWIREFLLIYEEWVAAEVIRKFFKIGVIRQPIDSLSSLEIKSEGVLWVLGFNEANEFSDSLEDADLVNLYQFQRKLIFVSLFFLLMHVPTIFRFVYHLYRQSEESEYQSWASVLHSLYSSLHKHSLEFHQNLII